MLLGFLGFFRIRYFDKYNSRVLRVFLGWGVKGFFFRIRYLDKYNGRVLRA